MAVLFPQLLLVSLLCSGVLCFTSPPKPSPNVLAWTKSELGAFFSFNMMTEITWEKPRYFCVGIGKATKLAPAEDFNPSLLNMDEWLETAASYGAKYAVLTAQHCSGFPMWPTDIYNETGFNYTYSIKFSPFMDGKGDIVRDFINSCKKYNIAPGIYYGLNENFYLNVGNGKVRNTTLYPGQVKVTQEQYNNIVLAQMRELWSNYGDLFEIWFDGGCISGLEDKIGDLSTQLQPNAVYFQGCSKVNNIRWIATETGEPTYPIWSTAMSTKTSSCTAGVGSVSGDVFCPAESDTTLQLNDEWFYDKDDGYRSVDTLKTVYMKTVGQNTNLLLNVVANSSGLIPDVARAIYKNFGEWIRSCFGTPIASTSGDGLYFKLQVDAPTEITKISVSEDQTNGEMVIRFTVSATTADGTTHTVVSNGQSIGNKFIADLEPMMVTAVELFITNAFDTPTISDFSIHQCLLY